MKIISLHGRARCAGHRRRRCAQAWPQKPVQLHRAFPAGRGDRHLGAPARREADADLGPAGGDREPRRRGRRRRRGRGGARGARRLHAVLPVGLGGHREPAHLRQAELRPGEGLRAGHQRRVRPAGAGGAGGIAVQDGEGPDRRGAGATRASSPSAMPASARRPTSRRRISSTQAKIDARARCPTRAKARRSPAWSAAKPTSSSTNLAAALPHISGGRLRALGVTSKAEAPQLPGVPPIAQDRPRASRTPAGSASSRPPARRRTSSTRSTATPRRRSRRATCGRGSTCRASRRSATRRRRWRGDEGGNARSGRGSSGSARSRSSESRSAAQVEEAAKELYIRALKVLPPDIKQGFDAPGATRDRRRREAHARHHDPQHRGRRGHRQPPLPGHRHPDLQRVDRARGRGRRRRRSRTRSASGCERATREYPLRSSVVHPITRKNEHTSLRPRHPGDQRRLLRATKRW